MRSTESQLKKVVFETESPLQTLRIGKSLGNLLMPGDVIALVGELGSGKTQLIKGVAAGAGVDKGISISSPSFTLINEYSGKWERSRNRTGIDSAELHPIGRARLTRSRIPFYHLDLFRLKTEKEAEGLGLEEYFDRGGIMVVEWADRIPSFLPEEMLRIQVIYTGRNSRSIEIIGKGRRYKDIVKKLRVADGRLRILIRN